MRKRYKTKIKENYGTGEGSQYKPYWSADEKDSKGTAVSFCFIPIVFIIFQKSSVKGGHLWKTFFSIFQKKN